VKSVLVTGAAGSLGSTVVETLARRGHAVVALDRLPRSASTPVDVKYIPLDLLHQEEWVQLPPGIDAVVHCAAYIPAQYDSVLEANTLWEVNALATLHLLTWARSHGVSQFVYCSSHSVYRQPLPFPVPETHPAYPTGRAMAYALSKLAGEIFVSSMREPGFDCCSLRLATIYGGRMKKSGVLYHFITQACQQQAIVIKSHPDSLYDFLFVQDAAQAIQLCLDERPRELVYNIGSGQGTSLEELARTTWALYAPLHSIPMISVETGSSKPIYSVLDIASAQRDLGYRPVFDIHAGLRAVQEGCRGTH
jgi:UDP-glucose 4-epimerase